MPQKSIRKRSALLAACRKKNFGSQISQIGADFGYFSPKNQRFQRLSAPHFDFSDSLLETCQIFGLNTSPVEGVENPVGLNGYDHYS